MERDLEVAERRSQTLAKGADDRKLVRLVVEVHPDLARAVKRAALDADLSIREFVIGALSTKLER